jgi:probable HAF family extracellular repeat protein
MGGYTAQRLPDLGGYFTEVLDINNAGQALGSAMTANGSFIAGVIWTQGAPASLLPLPGHAGLVVNAIDDSGRVAGAAGNVAVVWTNLTPVALGPIGWNTGVANAINAAGSVVGYGIPSHVGTELRALQWRNGQTIDMGDWLPQAINDNGLVAGFTDEPGTAGLSREAMVWVDGSATYLGTLGGQVSAAVAVNNSGAVVGMSTMAGNQTQRATLWANGSIVDLGTLSGTCSSASDISDAGLIVGNACLAGDAELHAVLWQAGQVIDLHEALSEADRQAGWVLYDATAINEAGVIAANAHNSNTGHYAAFILSPPVAVPEPAAWALALFGLLSLAGLRSRPAASGPA